MYAYFNEASHIQFTSVIRFQFQQEVIFISQLLLDISFSKSFSFHNCY